MNQSGNQFNIEGGTQAGGNLFHSFEQLNVSPEQVANFLAQPEIQNILGRVVGGNPSVINGLLQVSGGQANLYLMNPAGVLFGPNAQISVPGSFTATTASGIQLDEQWFNAMGSNDYANLVGEPHGFAFTADNPGAVVNTGNLTVPQGESVTLLGGAVLNLGTVSAPGGTITIAAVPGENLVRITQEGNLLSLDLPTALQDGAMTHDADSVSIPDLLAPLSGGNESQPLAWVVEGNVVRLVSNEATLPAQTGAATVAGRLDTSSNGFGGSVDVLGQQVTLVDATIDASGDTGGGQVQIGGAFQGSGPVPNAENTFVSSDSTIRADAGASGDGGEVIVWADENTRFYGDISARGGSDAGDGGFIEVSGKENLAFQGNIDVAAPLGEDGTLLLDPRNIYIVAAGTDDDQISDGTVAASDGGNGDFSISASALEQIIGTVLLQATENIKVANGLSLNFVPSSNSVTLEADANNDGSGDFLMNANQSINSNNRDLSITASSINAGNITTGEGLLTLVATGGNLETNAIRAGSVTMKAVPSLDSIDFSSEQGDIITGSIQATSLVARASGLLRVEGDNGVRFRNISFEEPLIELAHGGLPVSIEITLTSSRRRTSNPPIQSTVNRIINVIGGDDGFGFLIESDGSLPEGISGIRSGIQGSSTEIFNNPGGEMGAVLVITNTLFSKPGQGLVGRPRTNNNGSLEPNLTYSGDNDLIECIEDDLEENNNVCRYRESGQQDVLMLDFN